MNNTILAVVKIERDTYLGPFCDVVSLHRSIDDAYSVAMILGMSLCGRVAAQWQKQVEQLRLSNPMVPWYLYWDEAILVKRYTVL